MTYRLALVDKSKVLRLSKQGLGPTLISKRLGVSVARIMQIKKELLNEKGTSDSREDETEDGAGENETGGSNRQVF